MKMKLSEMRAFLYSAQLILAIVSQACVPLSCVRLAIDQCPCTVASFAPTVTANWSSQCMMHLKARSTSIGQIQKRIMPPPTALLTTNNLLGDSTRRQTGQCMSCATTRPKITRCLPRGYLPINASYPIVAETRSLPLQWPPNQT